MSFLISNTATTSSSGLQENICSMHCMSSTAHLTGPELILCQADKKCINPNSTHVFEENSNVE